MTPEAKDYLDKARADLEDARKIMTIPLAAIAARSAYYAVFHAAEGLIVQRVGKTTKTHAGVRTEFARLLKDAPYPDRGLLTFLAQAYKYKQLSDYGIGRANLITDAEAEDAINRAEAFLARVADWITKS